MVTLNPAANIDHADYPLPGDYWHEFFCPIAKVLMVDEDRVVLQKLAGGEREPEVMTRREFAKWLRYDTIPDKTWADVIPARTASDGGKP